MSGFTEAHLNPWGQIIKAWRLPLCVPHCFVKDTWMGSPVPVIPLHHRFLITTQWLTKNCIATQMLAEAQVHWQGLVSGVLSSLGSCAPAVGPVMAVAPLASLGTACWAVIVPAVLPYLLPCIGLHPISPLQHPELSVGAIQSVATWPVFANVFDVWWPEQLLAGLCCWESPQHWRVLVFVASGIGVLLSL